MNNVPTRYFLEYSRHEQLNDFWGLGVELSSKVGFPILGHNVLLMRPFSLSNAKRSKGPIDQNGFLN